jgi:hypothetical protein
MDGVMNVSGDNFSDWIFHIGKLLRKFVGGKEVNTVFVKTMGKDEGE